MCVTLLLAFVDVLLTVESGPTRGTRTHPGGDAETAVLTATAANSYNWKNVRVIFSELISM